MDYRRFLGRAESAVLPYLGGPTVEAPARRLRLGEPTEPGWWCFEVKGRTAVARERAEPHGLEARPRVRGHLWGGRLVREGAVAEPLHLLPEEEPARFAPVQARRWYDGSLVFESVDFESEAEECVRRALEEGQSLSGLKGVAASLRAAFGYGVLEVASQALGIRFAPAEVRGQVLAVAEGGRAVAEARLRRLAAEREAHLRALELKRRALEAVARAQAQREEAERRRLEEAARLEAELSRLRSRLGGRRPEQAQGQERVEQALESAGARLLHTRRLGHGWLEVAFCFVGERFVCVVDGRTLQVVDAGICLAGADREVTLESLPSVIREAVDTDRLVITR